MSKFLMITALAALCGCSNVMVDQRRPPARDFPQLDVVVRTYPSTEAGRICSKGSLASSLVASCVTYDFEAKQCLIHAVATGEPTEQKIAHANIERDCYLKQPYLIRDHCWRCLGYNSPGTMDSTDAWEAFKASSTKR